MCANTYQHIHMYPTQNKISEHTQSSLDLATARAPFFWNLGFVMVTLDGSKAHAEHFEIQDSQISPSYTWGLEVALKTSDCIRFFNVV